MIVGSNYITIESAHIKSSENYYATYKFYKKIRRFEDLMFVLLKLPYIIYKDLEALMVL